MISEDVEDYIKKQNKTNPNARSICHLCRLLKHNQTQNSKTGDKSEKKTCEHEACGFGYQVVRYDGQAEESVIYRGNRIPVIFHNLKGYVSHLIMQKIHTAKGNINCMPTIQKNTSRLALDSSSSSTVFSLWHLHWRHLWLPQTDPASILQLKSLSRKQINPTQMCLSI